ncbi:MAG: hypothetical protein LBL41_02545 [Bifidobacteriaceae bacterium]|nr:hypothetical protein [Bifidobacteriaceae bacterium]
MQNVLTFFNELRAVTETATNSNYDFLTVRSSILEVLDLFNPFSSHFTIFDVFLALSIITVLIAFGINIIKSYKSGM